MRVILAVVVFALPAMAQEDPPKKEPAAAPDPAKRELKLSLPQCVHMALASGLDIEIARYQPWIDGQGEIIALGTFDHVAYASITAGNSRSASTNAFGGATIIDVDSLTSKVGIRRALPVGLTADLFFQIDRSDTNSSFATIDPRYTDTLGLSLTMPILKGRGEEATYSGVVVARETRRISELAFEKTLADQVLAVHQAYWDLVFAIETKHVRDQSLQVAMKLLDETKTKFDRGLVAKVDVTEAESGVAGQQEGIITAENQVHTMVDRLKRLIDPALLRDDATIVPVDAPVVPAKEIDEKAEVARAMIEALARRADYRLIANQLAIQDTNLAKAENDRLPKLDLVASAGLNGTDDALNSAGGELADLDTRDWSLGVVFELPLEGRTAKGTTQRIELEKRRLWLQRKNLEDQILLEAREAVRAVKSAEKRIDATKKAADLAKEQLDGEFNRKQAGLRTTFHVLDSDKRLSEAKTNAIKALIDYQLALQQVYKASGTLLDRNSILIEQQLSPRLGK
jgi:outer membrane protein TolC